MAKKTAARPKRTTKKASKVKTVKRNNRFLSLAAIVLFAAIGTYFIVASHAQSIQSEQNALKKQLNSAARGIDYTDETIQTKGPCKGEVLESTDAKGKALCSHQDPGPAGQDVRVRAKKFDQGLKDQIAFDAAHPPLATDAPLDNPADAIPEDQLSDNTDTAPIAPPTDPTSVITPDDELNAGSLNSVNGRDWPCVTDGVSGPRVRVLYAYAKGSTNRAKTLRSVFENIMRRTNNVVYASSNGHRQIIFLTNPDCSLAIPAVAVTGDINKPADVNLAVRNAGYNRNDRKYIIMIDGGTKCGKGQLYPQYGDTTSPLENPNEITRMYSYVWKGCWNYGEPHEFMHTLGAVESTAPHVTTNNHCYDQHDIMCYQDDPSTVIRQVCTSTVQVWRYDCNDNDYFATTPVPGSYLSTHWNTADSLYLQKS